MGKPSILKIRDDPLAGGKRLRLLT